MGEGFPTEPVSLRSFVGKLEEVFDVCDEDSDGLIGLEDLLQLGSQFGQAEQVRTWLILKITVKSSHFNKLCIFI